MARSCMHSQHKEAKIEIQSGQAIPQCILQRLTPVQVALYGMHIWHSGIYLNQERQG